ncbi:MAG: hypothetical protein HC862_24970 [Scytonema sp. RU_4_4]|nr:hypothetical protein [Scytonema sp. RU_4_4]NJR76441.1 hypothetical protein [Scytonema sp. CRU_2_7]
MLKIQNLTVCDLSVELSQSEQENIVGGCASSCSGVNYAEKTVGGLGSSACFGVDDIQLSKSFGSEYGSCKSLSTPSLPSFSRC